MKIIRTGIKDHRFRSAIPFITKVFLTGGLRRSLIDASWYSGKGRSGRSSELGKACPSDMRGSVTFKLETLGTNQFGRMSVTVFTVDDARILLSFEFRVAKYCPVIGMAFAVSL
jgi:hypothetical protein